MQIAFVKTNRANWDSMPEHSDTRYQFGDDDFVEMVSDDNRLVITKDQFKDFMLKYISLGRRGR